MGTKRTSSNANIFMGRVEKQPLLLVPIKSLNWFRFMDYIETKWVEERESGRFCVLRQFISP